MNKKLGGEAIKMTNVLMNVENIIDTSEEEKNSKIDCLILYLKLRNIIKSDRAKALLKEHIIKDKSINSGRYTIKGTRITPEDIWELMNSNKDITNEQVLEEFPSLENTEQVVAAIIFCSRRKLNFFRLMFAK